MKQNCRKRSRVGVGYKKVFTNKPIEKKFVNYQKKKTKHKTIIAYKFSDYEKYENNNTLHELKPIGEFKHAEEAAEQIGITETQVQSILSSGCSKKFNIVLKYGERKEYAL